MNKQPLDRQVFLEHVNAIVEKVTDLNHRRSEFSEQRKKVRISLVEIQEALDNAYLQARCTINDLSLETAKKRITELDAQHQKFTQFESNFTNEISLLEQKIIEARGSAREAINSEKAELFSKLKTDLLEQIYRVYSLYRTLPTGDFKWDSFIADTEILEPSEELLRPFDLEWQSYFQIEEGGQ